ncbi:hypothetical protein D3C72_2493810 [compost metagenome]
MHGGNGDQGEQHKRRSGEARAQAEQQEGGRDQLDPHRQLPVQARGDQVEREGEG